MLLTDPEAPALATFCCVMFAAAAIAALASRVAPHSLWPICGVLLYLLCNLVEISDIGGSGGEFQKDHELTTALVVLAVWGICMMRGTVARSCLAMATSSAVAAAIVAQPMGIILTLYLALLGGWAMLRRRWTELWSFGFSAAAVGVTVLGVFGLSFLATGMATDQPLDLMLRFANVQRLDHWGVLPQLVTVAWLRENYAMVAPPFGWGMLGLLAMFTRVDVLWVFLAGPPLVLCVVAARWLREHRSGSTNQTLPGAAFSAIGVRTAMRIGALLGLLIVISTVMGRVQNISFARFSSFFVPLIILFSIALCGLALQRLRGTELRWWLGCALPVVLVIGTLLLWQGTCDWGGRVSRATAHGVQFLGGSYSLAEAYAHQDAGMPFGGINPEALAAWRHVEPDAAIWATNTFSYCMAPGCNIESVVSFKMSSRTR